MGDRGLADLFVEGVAPEVDLRVEPVEHELPLHPLGVVGELEAHRHHHHLLRRQPEGPLAAVVLDQDGRHPLDGAEDGAVDHDGPLEAVPQAALAPDDFAAGVLLHGALELGLVVLGARALVGALLAVLEVEPDRAVEVQLDGPALVLALHDVLEPDVDLRAVERAVTRVQCPVYPCLVQCCLKLLFCGVPDLLGAECLLGPRRKRV
mmetsp:Transcript_65608/g.184754  ORF Transcript_65608/g.184754 Transcript_65608/m.184754 type:complete len:207 (+) Transcript_65608:692-1312(+)